MHVTAKIQPQEVRIRASKPRTALKTGGGFGSFRLRGAIIIRTQDGVVGLYGWRRKLVVAGPRESIVEPDR